MVRISHITHHTHNLFFTVTLIHTFVNLSLFSISMRLIICYRRVADCPQWDMGSNCEYAAHCGVSKLCGRYLYMTSFNFMVHSFSFISVRDITSSQYRPKF